MQYVLYEYNKDRYILLYVLIPRPVLTVFEKGSLENTYIGTSSVVEGEFPLSQQFTIAMIFFLNSFPTEQ